MLNFLNKSIVPNFVKGVLDISRKTPLTSNPSSEDWYISCVIEINWFLRESPGLKSDWFGEITSHWNIQTDYFIWNAQKTFHKWEVEILLDNSLKSACHFSYGQWPRLPFFIHWETFRVWCKIGRLIQEVYNRFVIYFQHANA